MIDEALSTKLKAFDLPAIEDAANDEKITFNDVVTLVADINSDRGWGDYPPRVLLGEHELFKLAITKAQLTENFRKKVDGKMIFQSRKMEQFSDQFDSLLRHSGNLLSAETTKRLTSNKPFTTCSASQVQTEEVSNCESSEEDGFIRANVFLQNFHKEINENSKATSKGRCKISPDATESKLCEVANEDPYSLNPRVFVQKDRVEMSQRSDGHAIKVIRIPKGFKIDLLDNGETRITHFTNVAQSIGGKCQDREIPEIGRSVVCTFEDGASEEQVNHLAYMLNFYDSNNVEPTVASALFKALSPSVTAVPHVLSSDAVLKAGQKLAKSRLSPQIKDEVYKVLMDQI